MSLHDLRRRRRPWDEGEPGGFLREPLGRLPTPERPAAVAEWVAVALA